MKEQIAKIIQDGVCNGDSSWDEITIEILKFMREPTEKMKTLVTDDIVITNNCYYCGGHIDGWHAMIDCIIND